MIRTAAKFIAVGCANTCVGLSTIYLCKWLLGLGDATSNLIGYVVGLCLSFFLNRAWTFRHAGNVLAAGMRFFAVFAVAYLTNLCVVLGLIRAGTQPYLAHAIGMFPYSALFFLGSRYFAFPTPARASMREATRDPA
jgi:putative flippase GtrA